MCEIDVVLMAKDAKILSFFEKNLKIHFFWKQIQKLFIFRMNYIVKNTNLMFSSCTHFLMEISMFVLACFHNFSVHTTHVWALCEKWSKYQTLWHFWSGNIFAQIKCLLFSLERANFSLSVHTALAMCSHSVCTNLSSKLWMLFSKEMEDSFNSNLLTAQWST